jgi:uncharacterized protein (TIGR02266 family)
MQTPQTPLKTPPPVSDVVFVVDDSASVRMATCSQVREMGLTPLPLDGGDACLAALAQQQPLLILMDMQMPGMQGDEVCRRVKENPAWKDVPVIMYTTSDSPHQMMYFWRAAADDVLSKPAKPALFAAKVNAVRTAAAAPQPTARGSGREVLLVDDSRFYRTLLGGALEHEGYKVAYARDGAEARALLEARGAHFEGFVLDVNLPDCSGLELAEAIRQRREHPLTPICLATGFEQTRETQARLMRLRSAAFFEKRTVPADVLVRQLLGRLSPSRPTLRALERKSFFSVVEFCAAGTVGQRMTGFTYDASPGGLFVRTLTPMPEGSKVDIFVRSASQTEPLVAEAQVAWANPFRRGQVASAPVGMGLRLTRVPPALVQAFPLLGEGTP